MGGAGGWGARRSRWRGGGLGEGRARAQRGRPERRPGGAESGGVAGAAAGREQDRRSPEWRQGQVGTGGRRSGSRGCDEARRRPRAELGGSQEQRPGAEQEAGQERGQLGEAAGRGCDEAQWRPRGRRTEAGPEAREATGYGRARGEGRGGGHNQGDAEQLAQRGASRCRVLQRLPDFWPFSPWFTLISPDIRALDFPDLGKRRGLPLRGA